MAQRSVFLVLMLLAPALVHSWGAYGHRVIADVAWNFLNPTARKMFVDWSGDVPMESVANWPDEFCHTALGHWSCKLHYANMMKGYQVFVVDNITCPRNLCIVTAINDNIEKMSLTQPIYDPYTSNSATPSPIAFLIHFVGDCHQPLHIGFKSDRGGNEVRVTFFGKHMNLHEVWDDGFFEHHDETQQQFVSEILDLIYAHPSLVDRWNSSLNPTTWANESYQIVLNSVYKFSDFPHLGSEYFDANWETVRERIAASSIRLASVLNKLYPHTH